jgi:hypothetical protein
VNTRLGLAIGAGVVRAALVRQGRVVWTETRNVQESDRLADVIAAAVGSAPLRRFPRTPVIAAIGPAAAQVKRLPGVPLRAKQQVVRQLVHSNTSRFFLRNGVPLSATAAYRDGDCWWGAVIESPAVAAIEEACERSRATLEGCLPTITALASAQGVGDAEIEYPDGPVRAHITVRNGRWFDVRRVRDITEAPGGPIAIAAPREPEHAYQDAISAARSTRWSPLFLRAASRRTARHLVWLRALFATSAALSVTAMLLAPGLAASRRLSRDSQLLEELRGTTAAWAPALQQLRRTTSALNEIGRFSEDRRSASLILASIARALPDSTAILNVRIDSVGVTITLLSARAASIVPRLATIPTIVDPRIVGAVSRESVGGRQLQRIAVRFGFRARERVPTPARRRG